MTVVLMDWQGRGKQSITSGAEELATCVSTAEGKPSNSGAAQGISGNQNISL